MAVEGKTPEQSRLTAAQQMLPMDANMLGNVHGGVIMKLIDSTGGLVAMRHANHNVVTASIERLDFHNPVYVSDLAILRARIHMVGKSSMEVGVEVESENPVTGERRHTATAYLTFVALDENGKPTPVPPLILETDEDRRLEREALERKKQRLAERAREREGKGG